MINDSDARNQVGCDSSLVWRMQDDGCMFPSQCGAHCGDLDSSRALQAGAARSNHGRDILIV